MPDLHALALPAGPAWLAALERAWDAGHAVFPLDDRLAPAARDAVLDAVAPTHLVGADGVARPRAGGRGVEPGDALVVATSGTSGTTGAPRAVVHTRDALEASAAAVHARVGLRPDDRWLACLPLAHVGGFGVVARALIDGVDLELHPRFDAAAATRAAEGGATLVSLVATALGRLDPGVFRVVVLGGAAPPAVVPPNATVTYGLTETGGGVVYDGVPLDGVEVRIEPGGEIALRTPSLARAWRHGTPVAGPDGWFATGDLGAIDGGGRLVVHGRRGELIITGGENVWPQPVEDVLRTVPGVADVAVAGRPDAEWGQRVVAFVVPADPSRPPGLEELRDAVRATLAGFAAPRELVLVDELPRTALGKVRRAALAATPHER